MIMKNSKRIAVVLILCLISISGSALASEKSEQGLTLAQELTENPEPTVRAAALLTMGNAGNSEQRSILEEFKSADGEKERIAAGIGLILAGQRGGASFTAEQIREASGTYELLRSVSTMISEDEMESVVQAALSNAPAAKRRDIFRFLAGQTGGLYEMLGDQ